MVLDESQETVIQIFYWQSYLLTFDRIFLKPKLKLIIYEIEHVQKVEIFDTFSSVTLHDDTENICFVVL